MANLILSEEITKEYRLNFSMQDLQAQYDQFGTINLDNIVKQAIYNTYHSFYETIMWLFVLLLAYILFTIISGYYDIVVFKIPKSKFIEEEKIYLFKYLALFFRFWLYSRILYIGFFMVFG